MARDFNENAGQKKAGSGGYQNRGTWEYGVKLDKAQTKAVELYRETDRVQQRAEMLKEKCVRLNNSYNAASQKVKPVYPQAGHDLKIARDAMNAAIARRQELLDLKGVNPIRAVGRIIHAEVVRIRDVRPARDMVQQIKKDNPTLREDIIKAREDASEAIEKCKELSQEIEKTERQVQTLEKRAEKLQERADNARDDLGQEKAQAVDRVMAMEGNEAHALGHDHAEILDAELNEGKVVVEQEVTVEETFERRIEIERD